MTETPSVEQTIESSGNLAPERSPHIAIRERLRRSVKDNYQNNQPTEIFLKSVLSDWKNDEFFSDKKADLITTQEYVTKGLSAARSLLTQNLDIQNLLKQHNISENDFIQLCIANQLVYSSERLLLKHLVHGGKFPESEEKTLTISGKKISVDQITANCLNEDLSELHRTPTNQTYISDSRNGSTIAETLLAMADSTKTLEPVKDYLIILTDQSPLGFGRANRHSKVMLLGTMVDEDIDVLTRLSTAMFVFYHEETHLEQDESLPNLIAEIDAYIGQGIKSRKVGEAAHNGIIKIDESLLGVNPGEFQNEINFQDEIRTSGQLGEEVSNMTSDDLVTQLTADHNIRWVSSQVDKYIQSGTKPTELDW